MRELGRLLALLTPFSLFIGPMMIAVGAGMSLLGILGAGFVGGGIGVLFVRIEQIHRELQK